MAPNLVSDESFFLACRGLSYFSVLMWEMGVVGERENEKWGYGDLLGVSSYQSPTLNGFIYLNYLLKTLSPHRVTWEVEFSTYEFAGGHKHSVYNI